MEITVVVGIIGALIAVLSYFAGVKKSSNEDVEKRAYFEGQVTEKLDQLMHRFDRLEEQLSNNTSELYDEIAKQVEKHEERYHNGKQG